MERRFWMALAESAAAIKAEFSAAQARIQELELALAAEQGKDAEIAALRERIKELEGQNALLAQSLEELGH